MSHATPLPAPDPSGQSERTLVERLVSGDARQVNDAFGALHADLRPYAAAIMASRRINSRDAVTVVDCVLMRAAQRAAAVCGDDRELNRFLRRAVVNELNDQHHRDKRQPAQMPDDGSGWATPGVGGPGPATEAGNAEDRALDPQRAETFLATLAGVPLSEQKRSILDLFVLRGHSWETVVNSLDLPTLEAGRKAMSDMRGKLLPALMTPLRDDLPEVDRRVLDEFVIRRQAPDKVAALLGVDADAIIDSFGFRIVPAFERRYGKSAVAALRRLMHKPKA